MRGGSHGGRIHGVSGRESVECSLQILQLCLVLSKHLVDGGVELEGE